MATTRATFRTNNMAATLATTNQLVPTGCQLLTGAAISKNTRHDECPICGESLQAKGAAIVHKDCGNAYCIHDCMEWIQHFQHSSCPSCRGALGEPRPQGYEPTRERIYLVRNGVSEVMSVVGRAIFGATQMQDRLVTSSLALGDINVTVLNFHLAMLGGNIQDLYITPGEVAGIPDSRPMPSSTSIYQQQALRVANANFSSRILTGWADCYGVRECRELMFPEFSPHTRFLLPRPRLITVVPDLNALRDFQYEWRQRYAGHAESLIPGRWLKQVLSTNQLLLWLRPNQTEAMAAARLVDQSTPLDLDWVLYETYSEPDDLVCAVPRTKVSLPTFNPATNEEMALEESCFFDAVGGGLLFSNRIVPEAPHVRSDPELYNYAEALGNHFEHTLFATRPVMQGSRIASYAVSNVGEIELRPAFVASEQDWGEEGEVIHPENDTTTGFSLIGDGDHTDGDSAADTNAAADIDDPATTDPSSSIDNQHQDMDLDNIDEEATAEGTADQRPDHPLMAAAHAAALREYQRYYGYFLGPVTLEGTGTEEAGEAQAGESGGGDESGESGENGDESSSEIVDPSSPVSSLGESESDNWHGPR